jgi:hypothetical protein
LAAAARLPSTVTLLGAIQFTRRVPMRSSESKSRF